MASSENHTEYRKVIPECEVVLEGEDLEKCFNNCQKNPGHSNFIPVNHFRLEHLPEKLRTQETMDLVKQRIDRTVLIRVKYTSLNRPDTFPDSDAPYPYSKIKGSKRLVRFGTGNIDNLSFSFPVTDENCPCHLCSLDSKPKLKYWTFCVSTSTHVIFDDSEASQAVIKCFFDSDDNEGVVTLYGVKMNSLKFQKHLYETDVCDHVLCVTHDKTSAEKLKSRIRPFSLVRKNTQGPREVIISHPHGCSKMITVGNILQITIPIQYQYAVNEPTSLTDGTVCHLPSELAEGECSELPQTIGAHVYRAYRNEEIVQKLQQKSHLNMPFVRAKPFYEAKEHYNKTRCMTPTIRLEPGNDILLPAGTTFTLPAKAEYAMVYHNEARFRFPEGTKFTSPDGNNIPIPHESEFENPMVHHSRYSVSYSIDTCPGSSGATVCCDWIDEENHITHSGWDFQNNCNYSGIHSGIFMPTLTHPTPTIKNVDQFDPEKGNF